MDKLTHDDLMTLERYSRERPSFRAAVIAHKKQRTLRLGEHLALVFEDRQTVQYQIQEMLRIERIFEPEGIAAELDAYNPLIPDGHNLKATMLLEYPAPEARKEALAQLRGIEHHIYLRVADHGDIFAIADEDMQRSNPDKTAAVHFLRFELSVADIDDWRNGAEVALGCRLTAYVAETKLTSGQRLALAADFE